MGARPSRVDKWAAGPRGPLAPTSDLVSRHRDEVQPQARSRDFNNLQDTERDLIIVTVCFLFPHLHMYNLFL